MGRLEKIRTRNSLLLKEAPEYRQQAAQFAEGKGDGNRMPEISDADREYICRNSHMFTYPKGRNIHNGEECSGVLFVCSGSRRLYMMSDEGKEITLYRLHRGCGVLAYYVIVI